MNPNETKSFDASAFSRRIKEERENKHLTQNEVAKYLFVTQQAIQRYENGERQPDIITLYQLALLFEVSVDYLLGLSSARSTNGDTKEISHTLGLSEKTIKNIMSMPDLPAGSAASNSVVYASESLDYFLGSKLLFDFSFFIASYVSNTKKFLIKILENPYVNKKYINNDFNTAHYSEDISNLISDTEFCEFRLDKTVNNIVRSLSSPIYEKVKAYYHKYEMVLFNIEEDEETIKNALFDFIKIKNALRKEGISIGKHNPPEE